MLLVEHPVAATPSTHALAALMCFHAARLPARVDTSGNLSSLYDQDRSRWDPGSGGGRSTTARPLGDGVELTEYHLEAAIAAVHANAHRVEDTNWGQIVALYDRLLTIRPSPVVALNRAIAVAQHEGAERGLEEIRAIAGLDRLAGYPFYAATLGELELRSGRHEIAAAHFQAAVALARNPMERRFFEQRLGVCAAGAAQGLG